MNRPQASDLDVSMSVTDERDAQEATVTARYSNLLQALMESPATTEPRSKINSNAVVVAELIALADNGSAPVVMDKACANPIALRARSIVDLHSAHIGRQVVLSFEQGDPTRPIVMGVLRDVEGWPQPECPPQVEVTADNQRVVVTARQQLVLQCGRASITLTRVGKVIIDGTYVLSRATGLNRVKGGSIQLN